MSFFISKEPCPSCRAAYVLADEEGDGFCLNCHSSLQRKEGA